MKPAPFAYHAPTSIADAVALLAGYGDDAKALAGGQSLVPMLALRLARFDHLVDLNRVDELRGVTRQGEDVIVGAMTRQAVVERDPVVANVVPLLARATPLVGHFQIRNRGTVGGSLAHADPASEYPAVAVALGATFDIAGDNSGGEAGTTTRSVDADSFFVGTWRTCVEADELLASIRFPVWKGRCGFAVEEIARRAGDFALVGAACGIGVDTDGAVCRAGIGLFGVGATPVHASVAEAALLGQTRRDVTEEVLREIGDLAVTDLDPPDDIHASGRYRRQVASRLVARALSRALEEAADA